MDSQSNEVLVKLADFAPQGLATTAWAYSSCKVKDSKLLAAISAEVMRKLDEIEPQSLGLLADAKLACREDVERALQPLAKRFAEQLPMVLDDVLIQRFAEQVRETRVDNFGAWGTRYVLEQMGLRSPESSFLERAAAEIVKAGASAAGPDEGSSSKERQDVLSGSALVHRRVFSYGEFSLEVPGLGQPVTAAMTKENGRRDRSFDPRSSVLRPLSSPISGLVDRSLCSEFQLLSAALESLSQLTGTTSFAPTRGFIRLFVSTSPCVSCIWAIRQCQIHLPQVMLEVANGEEAYIFSASPEG